jgi:hypothetical protein
MRTWATITAALFFISAFGAGLAGDPFNGALFSFCGGAFLGVATAPPATS